MSVRRRLYEVVRGDLVATRTSLYEGESHREASRVFRYAKRKAELEIRRVDAHGEYSGIASRYPVAILRNGEVVREFDPNAPPSPRTTLFESRSPWRKLAREEVARLKADGERAGLSGWRLQCHVASSRPQGFFGRSGWRSRAWNEAMREILGPRLRKPKGRRRRDLEGQLLLPGIEPEPGAETIESRAGALAGL